MAYDNFPSGFFAGLLFTIVFDAFTYTEPSNIASQKLQDLRLSERKTSSMTIEERDAKFQKSFAPVLEKGSLEYKVLQRVCIDGVYGSETDDWKVSTQQVSYTLDACGWKLPAERTQQ